MQRVLSFNQLLEYCSTLTTLEPFIKDNNWYLSTSKRTLLHAWWLYKTSHRHYKPDWNLAVPPNTAVLTVSRQWNTYTSHRYWRQFHPKKCSSRRYFSYEVVMYGTWWYISISFTCSSIFILMKKKNVSSFISTELNFNDYSLK
jgi:hypothetical protein